MTPKMLDWFVLAIAVSVFSVVPFAARSVVWVATSVCRAPIRAIFVVTKLLVVVRSVALAFAATAVLVVEMSD